MAEKPTWDGVTPQELARAIGQLLERGQLRLPVCPRCGELLIAGEGGFFAKQEGDDTTGR